MKLLSFFRKKFFLARIYINKVIKFCMFHMLNIHRCVVLSEWYQVSGKNEVKKWKKTAKDKEKSRKLFIFQKKVPKDFCFPLKISIFATQFQN